MNKTSILGLGTCVLTLVFGACATTPESQQTKTEERERAKDKRPLEERLRVGMTREEVRVALGEPAGKSTNSEKLESWNYNDNAKAFIPFYALGGGKFQRLTINFDAEGKVKDWSSAKESMF